MQSSQFYLEQFNLNMTIFSEFLYFLPESITFLFVGFTFNIPTYDASLQLFSQVIVIFLKSFDQAHEVFVFSLKEFLEFSPTGLAILAKLVYEFIKFVSDIFIFDILFSQSLFVSPLNTVSLTFQIKNNLLLLLILILRRCFQFVELFFMLFQCFIQSIKFFITSVLDLFNLINPLKFEIFQLVITVLLQLIYLCGFLFN